MGSIVKNAPTSLIWAVTLAFLGVVAAFVVLAATGSDTSELRAFLNLMLTGVGALTGSGALIASAASAKSAGKAEEHGNGNLAAKDAEIANLRAANEQLRQSLVHDGQAPS